MNLDSICLVCSLQITPFVKKKNIEKSEREVLEAKVRTIGSFTQQGE
jgi:hypothetical protein